MLPDRYFFPLRKTSRSTVKHGWNHRSISSGMTHFYDEHWTYLQYDTNWIPFAESIHACAWFTFRETFQMHFFTWLFDMLTWECSVAPGRGCCEVESTGDIPTSHMRHLNLTWGGGKKERENPNKSHEMTSLQTFWPQLDRLSCCVWM